MTNVLVAASFPEPLMEKIRAVSPKLQVQQIDLPDGRWPESKSTDAEIYYTFRGIPDVAQAPHLRWVQLHSAGADHLRPLPIWHSDIAITTASGVHGPNIAQYIMAQLLAWANHIPRWVTQQQAGEWPQNRWKQFVSTELRGQTVGILGYGSIGREVARLAKAFGMTVLVTKRNLRHLHDTGYIVPGTGDPAGELPDRLYPGEATRSMLAECDYAVLTLPLTDDTHHLLDEAMLKAMKPTAYVVNVGRGSLIDEKALIKALQKGWIAGAGLDVFETEPLPSSSPLWQMENVILTPHVSGFTPAYDERATDIFVANLHRYLAGEPLLNKVDRVLGY
jgi:phosphoglycerate dehydrogenase-like enzyme